jgi:hypothetical protein
MNTDVPLEWLSRQGHRIYISESSYWYDIGPKIYQSFPYHEIITPSSDEIKQIFKQTSAIAIRYSTPINQPEGQISYHVIYEKGDYEIAGLPKKARHDVVHGLKYAIYENISLQRLASEGWYLREDTLIRQGRKNAESRQFWESLCLSAEGLGQFEAWGALHDGSLVAALLACTIGDTVSIYYQQSLSQHLKYGVNNTLTFTFCRNVLQRDRIKSIFYGLHSLDAPPSVDEYKFRMRFTAKPVRQRVIFNPLVVPFIRPGTHLVLQWFGKIIPGNSQIAKAEGMARFYLQGKKPLPQQHWPEILRNQTDLVSNHSE